MHPLYSTPSPTDWLVTIAIVADVLIWKCSALSRGRGWEVRVRLVSKQNETRPISFTFQCHCCSHSVQCVWIRNYCRDSCVTSCATCFVYPTKAQELNLPSDDMQNHESSNSSVGSNASCCVLNLLALVLLSCLIFIYSRHPIYRHYKFVINPNWKRQLSLEWMQVVTTTENNNKMEKLPLQRLTRRFLSPINLVVCRSSSFRLAEHGSRYLQLERMKMFRWVTLRLQWTLHKSQ